MFHTEKGMPITIYITLLFSTVFLRLSCAVQHGKTDISVPTHSSSSPGHTEPNEGIASHTTSDYSTTNRKKREETPGEHNNWGFQEESKETDDERRTTSSPTPPPMSTTSSYYEEVDPNHNGLLKSVGNIDIGFKVGVAVPGNDPVSVGAKIGVGLGESGLASRLPIGQNIYPRQGEYQSLNDYDGNKYYIVADKASKYIQAIREGRLRVPHYRPANSLVGISGGVGIGQK